MNDVAISNWAISNRQPDPAAGRRQRLIDLAARLSRTMAVARGLIRGGRKLDMTGIDDGIGVLCAQTLDLPPEEASAMLPVLRGVLTEVESLTAELHRPAAGPRTRC